MATSRFVQIRARFFTSGRITLAVAAVAIAGTATGCTRPGPATPAIQPAAVISHPAETSVDTSAATAAKTAALHAYNSYLAAYVTAAHTASWSGKTIDKYTADPFRQQAHLTLQGYAQSHVVLAGRPRSHPTVAAVNISSSPRTVLLTDCVDATEWRPIIRSTGKPAAAVTAPKRYSASIVVVEYPGHTWLVQQVTKAAVPSC